MRWRGYKDNGPDRWGPGFVLTSDVGYGIGGRKSEDGIFARMTSGVMPEEPEAQSRRGGVLSFTPGSRPETMGTRWT